MPSFHGLSTAQLAASFRRLLLDASAAFLIDDRYVNQEVIQLVVGSRETADHRRFVSSDTTYERIAAHFRVGVRRAQQILRNEIAPAIFKALQDFTNSPNVRADTLWRDCRISLAARPHDDPNLYVLRAVMEFQSSVMDVIVAITDAEEDADRLCAECPNITEILVPSRGMAAFPYLTYAPDSNAERFVKATAVKMNESEISELLGEAAFKYDAEYYRFVVNTDAKEVRYRLILDQELSVRTHCFWSVPRRIHLQRLDIDFSGFPNSALHEFSVVPRLGGGIRTDSDQLTKTFKVIGPKWVLPGQSVIVNWSEHP
ncbi:hypothetical protein [Antrihabitans spumae]|uniref:RNA polymerase sigma-70 region 4 domain-containing protein n=1 Tax=Antrihabitans spumae TaxID=3373370 RepID=A0ABW7KY78_9NOCA